MTTKTINLSPLYLTTLKLALEIEVRTHGRMMLTSRGRSGGSPKTKAERIFGCHFRTKQEALEHVVALREAIAIRLANDADPAVPLHVLVGFKEYRFELA